MRSRKFILAVVAFFVLIVIGVGFFLQKAGPELWGPWFTAFIANITQYGVVNVGQKAMVRDSEGSR